LPTRRRQYQARQPWEVNEDLLDCLGAYYNDVQEDNIKTYDIGEGCDSEIDTE